ncbi:MAG: hypothetical protein Q8Q97_02960 [bacterium]|nr:hypothetical protein [bacterium]
MPLFFFVHNLISSENATRLAYSQHTNKLQFVGMLFKAVGDGVADFADLFHFALFLQFIQITHSGAAGYSKRLADFAR